MVKYVRVVVETEVRRWRANYWSANQTGKGVRRVYGDLFAHVSSALFAADPIGINFGSNFGEYEPEASTIIPRLRGCHSIQDVQAVVHEEFVAWFGLEDDDRCASPQSYVVLAEDIWGVVAALFGVSKLWTWMMVVN